MWKANGEKAYPFHHHHNNHFPPRPPPLTIPPPLTPNRIPLETCYEDSDEDEDAEIPIILHSPLVRTPRHTPHFSTTTIREPSTPPPFNFNFTMEEPPQTPSSIAPANLTNLLQDVLGIMNTIMESRAEVLEEDAILQELTELVVIMQEEAEMLVEVSDLVEEYCGEVECEVEVREMEEWCFELGIGAQSEVRGHEREDSGVGLECDGEKDVGGGVVEEFMDDRSLEEMKPAVLESDLSNGGNLRDVTQQPEEIRATSRQPRYLEPTLASTKPPPKSAARHVRLGQKPRNLKIEEAQSGGGQKSKKGKEKKVPPPFRDSGLGLSSPSPRGSPISRTPRWI